MWLYLKENKSICHTLVQSLILQISQNHQSKIYAHKFKRAAKEGQNPLDISELFLQHFTILKMQSSNHRYILKDLNSILLSILKSPHLVLQMWTACLNSIFIYLYNEI